MQSATHTLSRPRRFRMRHALLVFLVIVILALIAARLYLPIWLRDYVNEQLNSIPGYKGNVESIDVQLYRGAYTIHGLTLEKIDAGIPVPFLAIKTADLSLQWGALFNGHIVSEVSLNEPNINFAIGKSGAKQTGRGTDWNETIKRLMPIDINVVEILNGKISYRDFSSSPKVDIFITNINGTLNELRNTEDKNVALPSTINITGRSIGDGALAVKGRLNILTRLIDMDIDAKLEEAKLTAFNSFSEAYGAIKFKAGKMSVYSELAIKNGNVRGYVKPLVHDLSVDRIPTNTNPLQVAWSTFASVLFKLFENLPRDQFATKVPLSGSLDKVETSFWPALGGIIRNAFFKAFEKGTDNEIQFQPKPIKPN